MDGIGHNAPPPDLKQGDDLRILLESQNEALLTRARQLIAAEERIPAITNDETAGKVSDFIKQVSTCSGEAEDRRKIAKRPYTDAGASVDGFFKAVTDPLSGLKARVLAKLNSHLQAKEEAERKARAVVAKEAQEESDRLARAATKAAESVKGEITLGRAIEAEGKAQQAEIVSLQASKAAGAKASDLSQTRGDFGSVASLRTAWDFEITDLNEIPRNLLMVNETAIRAHMKARLKNQPPAPVAGVRFFEKKTTAVR